MKLAIALSVLLVLSSNGSTNAFVTPSARLSTTNKPTAVLDASKNGWVAAASSAAAVVGMTVASQAASASFTTLAQKASTLPGKCFSTNQL